MAALLNFFKYRSTAERIVKERLVVVADSIETGIQQSLTCSTCRHTCPTLDNRRAQS